jgi:hypothetical protein
MSVADHGPLASAIVRLVCWHHPLNSALVLFTAGLAAFLVTSGGYSVLSLVSLLVLLQLLVCFVYMNFARMLYGSQRPVNGRAYMDREHPLHAEYELFSPVAVDALVRPLCRQLNTASRVVVATLRCKSNVHTLLVAGVVAAIAALGQVVSGAFFLFLLLVAAFTIPRVYLRSVRCNPNAAVVEEIAASAPKDAVAKKTE